MDKESDVIKHQMEHTRAALTDKLELLEHQVSRYRNGAAGTVEKVRQTVQDRLWGCRDGRQHATLHSGYRPVGSRIGSRNG